MIDSRGQLSMLLDYRNLRWYGQKVERFEGKIDELYEHLPSFKLMPCGKNQYLRLVVREKVDKKTKIPVATVSRDYALIQHQWLLETVVKSLKTLELPVDNLQGTLHISEYGERIQVLLWMPVQTFDPGDGYPLAMMMQIYNSVDKTCALEISLRWLRLVCGNGMVTDHRSDFRAIHIRNCINEKRILMHLKNLLNSAGVEAETYTQWLSTKVDLDAVRKWVNDSLTPRWGKHLAERTVQIAEYGYDIQPLADPHMLGKKPQPTQVNVPGACAPVSNVYHLSQILSWLAGQRNSVEDQMRKVGEIPSLIAPLLSRN